jgi:prepilin-type N-terminal cleavage/methylation domain-containing protein
MTRRGFTVMEVLTVVAMIGIVAVVASPLLSAGQVRADARRFATEATDAIREAQASVMSGKNDARFGVHFEGSRFVLFQGATYAPADPNNVVHQLSGLVSITAVSLSPGGACTLPAGTGNCDLHFAGRKGAPTETGSVTFTDAEGNAKTVTVNAAGMVDVN